MRNSNMLKFFVYDEEGALKMRMAGGDVLRRTFTPAATDPPVE